jgi:hypothetical protein
MAYSTSATKEDRLPSPKKGIVISIANKAKPGMQKIVLATASTRFAQVSFLVINTPTGIQSNNEIVTAHKTREQ